MNSMFIRVLVKTEFRGGKIEIRVDLRVYLFPEQHLLSTCLLH